MRRRLLLLVLLAGAAVIADETRLFPILKSTVRLGRQPEGFYLVPTNQLLRPWGRLSLISGRPVDMAFDSHHRTLAVLNWRSVLLLDGVSGVRIGEVESRATSYAGIAFRPGDRELWASETSGEDRDTILIIQLSELGAPILSSRIALPGHPVPIGIAFSADGSAAYVALSRDNALAVIDTASRQVVRRIQVGMAPFGVAAAKNGTIYVSNRGGRRPHLNETVAPSSGSEVLTDPVTGSSISGTVSVVDAASGSVREIPVGLAPSQLALSPARKLLAVADGHSDAVTLLDTQTLEHADVNWTG